MGIGVDDVFVDGREMDPLRLRDATDEQVHRWYDMTSAIMSHEFNRTTGTGQEWSPEEAHAMKRCRRAALVRLVRHMDEELGFQRNEENRRASKIIRERLLLLRDNTGEIGSQPPTSRASSVASVASTRV